MNLSNFQEIVGMALDLIDEQASLIQRSWPGTKEELRRTLRLWKASSASDIKGHELLSVCNEIWHHKPGDLATEQGRDILYHPVSGLPVQPGSPMDGITWETLAFLRWSVQMDMLRWSDEVVIAREVKFVGGSIAELPGDRFYGKNVIPRNREGNIDWSNLSLSQAKAFVLTGASADVTESVQPMYIDETSLEGVLLSIPALQSQDSRNHLLRGLPPGPCGAISRPSAPLADIGNIVGAAESFGKLVNGRMAINVVIDNAIRLVLGTSKAKDLEKFKLI